jgi:hypothetical protein
MEYNIGQGVQFGVFESKKWIYPKPISVHTLKEKYVTKKN